MMTIPAIPGPQQPTAVTHRPGTVQNTQIWAHTVATIVGQMLVLRRFWSLPSSRGSVTVAGRVAVWLEVAPGPGWVRSGLRAGWVLGARLRRCAPGPPASRAGGRSP